MRNLFVASGICALMALVSSPAEASLITLTPGSSFTGLIATPAVGQPACATCSALATFGLSADGLHLSVSLTNTSTDGIAGSINLLTGFGFETSPDIVLPGGNQNDPPTNLAGIVYSGDFATGWETTNKGGGLNYELVLSTQKGLKDALDGGDSGSAVFTFLNPWSSLNLDAAGVHIQSMVDGNSVKLVCCTTGEGEGGGGEGEGGGGEGEGGGGEGEGGGGEGSVPEPASLLLFGIGLSGAAVRFRRTR